MKKSGLFLFLAVLLVFAMSSSLVSSHKINNFNDPSANTHAHYDKLEIEIPDDEEDFFKNDTKLYFDSGSPDLIGKNDNLYISFPNGLLTDHPNKYSDGIHQITDKGADPSGEWIGISNPRFQDAPYKTSYRGGTDNTYVEYNFSLQRLSRSDFVSFLETPDDGDSCVGQNYVLKEDWGSRFKKHSCIANYSADSRCYSGACQSCIDYDSKDGLSGNYTEKGVTWNESYDFLDKEGKTDTCLNSTHLIEYSCNPNDPSDSHITGKVVNCETEFKVPYTCQQGECYCNSTLDYRLGSCTSDELATLWDANCQVLDQREVPCDYDNLGVVGDAIPFDSVKIDGKEYDNTTNYTDTGTRDVEIMKNGDFVRFDWDTKDNGDDPTELGDELNLEAIDFSSSRQGQKRGFVFVNNLSNSKTVLFDKFTGSKEVCVKDSKGVDSLNDFSNDCSGSNEVKLDCPGSSGKYNCEIVKGGSHYKVWPLKHSGVVELTGSGINTNNICIRSDLNCNPSDWSNVSCSNGTKSRNCSKKQGASCSGGISNYETTTCSSDSGGSDGLSGSSGSGDVDAESDNLSNNTCTRNDWRCTSWGDCSDGTKERVCSKKFDSSCSGGTVPEDTSTEGCSTDSSNESGDTKDSSDGLPGWALAAIIGGAGLFVAIIVFFIVANKR